MKLYPRIYCMELIFYFRPMAFDQREKVFTGKNNAFTWGGWPSIRENRLFILEKNTFNCKKWFFTRGWWPSTREKSFFPERKMLLPVRNTFLPEVDGLRPERKMYLPGRNAFLSKRKRLRLRGNAFLPGYHNIRMSVSPFLPDGLSRDSWNYHFCRADEKLSNKKNPRKPVSQFIKS